MPETNTKKRETIICGDNFHILHNLADAGLQVDLVYLDPPFFSGRNYEIIWETEDGGKETRRFEDTLKSLKDYKPNEKPETDQYDERMSGGINTYLIWMRDRLKQMYRILKPTGSIYLHCDWHASHYLKVEMDKIFGYENFQNEIVWCYSGGGLPKKDYPRKHDTILRYTKGDKYTFNVEYKPYKANTQQVGKHSTLSKGNLDIDLKRGTPVTDWWTDVETVTGWSPEKKGYPTQKPQALLERIIKASSNEGDLILDPFCGCGTCVEVAQKLKRNFIAIDVSPKACKIIAKGVGIPYDEIKGMPMTRKHLDRMEPYEFQDWVCKIMDIRNTSPDASKHSGGDGGFDGEIISPKVEKYLRGCPVQVKQSESIGVNVVRNLIGVMVDKEVKYGFIVAHSFGSGAIELVSKLLLDNKYSITLITTEKLMEINQGNKYQYKENVVK